MELNCEHHSDAQKGMEGVLNFVKCENLQEMHLAGAKVSRGAGDPVVALRQMPVVTAGCVIKPGNHVVKDLVLIRSAVKIIGLESYKWFKEYRCWHE